MKWYQKILFGFLVLVLVNLLCVLAISANLKSVLINGVIKEVIKEEVFQRPVSDSNNTISDEQINQITDDEKIKEILKSPEIQALVDKYLDITIESLNDDSKLNEIELEKDMLEYLKENKETLSEVLGQEVTEEMIEKTGEQFESKEMSKVFKQNLINTKKNMSTTEKKVLKGYSFLISNTFKMILFVLIIIDLVLIAIIQKSWYKWIKTFGKSLLTSGVLVITMSLIVNWIVSNTSKLKTFHSTPLTHTGIIMVVIGLLIVIIYVVTSKIIRKEKKNEVS